jgi:hypothetical protein
MGGHMRAQKNLIFFTRKHWAYLALTCAVVSWRAQAAPAPQLVSAAGANGLAWLYQHQNGDGGWGVGATGSSAFATSAALDAFMGFGISKGIAYTAGVANLANAVPLSTDARARQITTLNAVGLDVSALTQVLVAQPVDGTGGWGPLPNYGASTMDTALAAYALSKATSSGYTPAQLTALVCNVFGPGEINHNGWGYALPLSNAPSGASSAALLPTVYSVLALQNMVGKVTPTINCTNGTYILATLISDGVTFLKTKQNAADKGFGESGVSSVLETALVYMAIKATNTSDLTLGDAQNYLVNTQDPAGSWSYDAFTNALALQVFAAPLSISGQDGVPDAVKQALKLASANAIAPNYMPGNGQAIAGSTTSTGFTQWSPVPQTYLLGVPVFYTFPENYANLRVISGALPPGLNLGGTTLSGTPTAVGRFSMLITYLRIDASPYYWVTQDMQIIVAASPSAVNGIKVSPSPADKRSPATLTATVLGNQPYGSVQFFDGTTLVATATVGATDAAVTATQTTFTATTSVNLKGGFRKITAVYSGDTRNQSSTSAVKIVPVNPDAAAVLKLLLQ